MAFDVNFGLANPQVAFNPTADMQAGQQLGQQRATQNALQQYNAGDPNGAINALVRAGALQQANALTSMDEAKRARDADIAGGQALAGAYQADGTVDPTKLIKAAGGVAGTSGLKAATPLFAEAKTAQEYQDAQMKIRSDAIGKYAVAAQGIDKDSPAVTTLLSGNASPTPQDVQAAILTARRAFLSSPSVLADLAAKHVAPTAVQAAAQNPTDDALNGYITAAGTTADALKKQSGDADYALKLAGQAETLRHNQAAEGTQRIIAGADVTRAGAAVTSAGAAARNASTAAAALGARTGPDGKLLSGGKGARPNVTLQTGGLGITLPAGAAVDPDN